MNILFGFNSQFIGKQEIKVNFPQKEFTDDEIIDMFEDILGIPFDENCYFERLWKNKCIK